MDTAVPPEPDIPAASRRTPRHRAGRRRPWQRPAIHLFEPGQSRGPTLIVARDKRDRPVRVGRRVPWWRDIYHHVLSLSWLEFLGLGIPIYLAINVIFALLYMRDPSAIANARLGSFWDHFFFSVETLATIGYGQLYPADPYANTLMTVETLLSLFINALLTGLVFARFSRPSARVDFSAFAVVNPRNGVPTLMVRLANARANQILQADVTMTLLRMERTMEGEQMRRFYDLALERDRTPVFALTFLLMHPMNAASPLHGATVASLAAENAEILVTVSGLDETMAQTIHARHSYLPDEIRFGHRFADLFGYTDDGRLGIDLARFDVVEPI